MHPDTATDVPPPPSLVSELGHFADLKCEDPWPPKHGYQAPRSRFRSFPAERGLPPVTGHPYSNALAVVIVRNPWDWALAMHKYCWLV